MWVNTEERIKGLHAAKKAREKKRGKRKKRARKESVVTLKINANDE